MWYECFNIYFINIGFTQGAMDFNNYIKRESIHQKIVILGLYIDNSIIIGNDIDFLHGTKKCLVIGFEMTNEGPIKKGRCNLQ
jgi:hypothetical protein